MTWIRSSLGLLLSLALLGGCGNEASVSDGASDHLAEPRSLVQALQSDDPAMRRAAAEGLGDLERAPLEVIHALMLAQHDDDPGVAEAAVEALDRIHPPPEVALRVFGADCYEEIAENVIVRPATVTWRRAACEPAGGPDDARPLACWTLVEVPPVYETRIKNVLVHPEAGRWRPAHEVRADDLEALRASPPPPPVRPIEKIVPPEGEPDGAQPGEVWCWYESSSSGGLWRRHPECE